MAEACSCACGIPQNSDKYKTVKPEEFSKEIKSVDVYLLDVRKPDEFSDGHIHGAANLDVTDPDFTEKALKELPKDKTIAVYCGSGKRSAMAASKLTDAGFKILNLDGGLTAWKDAGLPVEK